MVLLMILVRRPSGPSYRYAIGYRDTRADKPGTTKPLRFHFYWRQKRDRDRDREKKKGRNREKQEEREKEREKKREKESVPKRVQGLRLLDRPRRLSMISFTSKWKRANKTGSGISYSPISILEKHRCLRLVRLYEIILFLLFLISLLFYLIRFLLNYILLFLL